jgi:aldose 1-epimerase
VPAPEGKDLRGGVSLDGLNFDDVYAGLRDTAETGEWTEVSYTDPEAGAKLLIRSDPSFRELVVHAPCERAVICIEPYTCVTDAFNLESRGVDAGMNVLPPGQEWRAEVHYIPQQIIRKNSNSWFPLRN